MEERIPKLAKKMDYLKRAKRDEAAPLIEAVYQRRLAEEEALHECEQKLEIEQSRQRHAQDLEEQSRIARMLENKVEIKQSRRRRAQDLEEKSQLTQMLENKILSTTLIVFSKF